MSEELTSTWTQLALQTKWVAILQNRRSAALSRTPNKAKYTPIPSEKNGCEILEKASNM